MIPIITNATASNNVIIHLDISSPFINNMINAMIANIPNANWTTD